MEKTGIRQLQDVLEKELKNKAVSDAMIDSYSIKKFRFSLKLNTLTIILVIALTSPVTYQWLSHFLPFVK